MLARSTHTDCADVDLTELTNLLARPTITHTSLRLAYTSPHDCCVYCTQLSSQATERQEVCQTGDFKHMPLLQHQLVSVLVVRVQQIVRNPCDNRPVCSHLGDAAPEPLSVLTHLDPLAALHVQLYTASTPLLKRVLTRGAAVILV